MADEIDFENGRISNFQHHVTLTLDLGLSCIISFKSEKLFVHGQMYTRTYIHTDRETDTDIEDDFIR